MKSFLLYSTLSFLLVGLHGCSNLGSSNSWTGIHSEKTSFINSTKQLGRTASKKELSSLPTVTLPKGYQLRYSVSTYGVGYVYRSKHFRDRAKECLLAIVPNYSKFMDRVDPIFDGLPDAAMHLVGFDDSVAFWKYISAAILAPIPDANPLDPGWSRGLQRPKIHSMSSGTIGSTVGLERVIPQHPLVNKYRQCLTRPMSFDGVL